MSANEPNAQNVSERNRLARDGRIARKSFNHPRLAGAAGSQVRSCQSVTRRVKSIIRLPYCTLQTPEFASFPPERFHDRSARPLEYA